MASRCVCVVCEDQTEGSSFGSCATCLKTAAHDTDGSLCPGCFAHHEKGKGLWRGHEFSKDSRAETAAAVLARAGLVACPARCAEHGKAVDIACTTCREPALCVSCLSKHPGHSLLVLVEAAPIARSLLREAAGGFSSSDASAATAIEAARASAQRIARERDELPDRITSAAECIDALRDSLLAAVVARHAALRAALAATDAAVGAALAAELAVSDGLQQQASVAASDLAAAAEGLADADAVAHADALIDRSSRVRAAIASLPPRPATASLVALEVDAGAEAALLQGIVGLGRVVARGEGEKSVERTSLTSGPPPPMPGARRLAGLGASDAVRHVLRQVKPEVAVRAHAMAAMLELLSRLLDKLGAAARAACQAEGGPGPVSTTHVTAAITAVLSGELAKHAKSEVGRAAAKVTSGDENGGLLLTTKLLRPAISAALTVPGASDPDENAMAAAAAVLEYVCAEIWELAGNTARVRVQAAAGAGGCAGTSAEVRSEPIFLVPDDICGVILKDEELAKLGLFSAPPAAASTSGLGGCAASKGGSGRGCDEGEEDADFQWRSRDPANDAAEFGWAAPCHVAINLACYTVPPRTSERSPV